MEGAAKECFLTFPKRHIETAKVVEGSLGLWRRSEGSTAMLEIVDHPITSVKRGILNHYTKGIFTYFQFYPPMSADLEQCRVSLGMIEEKNIVISKVQEAKALPAKES